MSTEPRLDVEAAGRHEEVQKERARAADWTLKRREDTKKSKKSEPEPRIGRQSGGKHGGSPKGVRKSGGLDVEVAGSTEEVQNKIPINLLLISTKCYKMIKIM